TISWVPLLVQQKHWASSFICYLRNTTLAQRLKDNHQRLSPEGNVFGGLSHLGSGRSQKGRFGARLNRVCAKKARCCQLWPGVGSSFCSTAA
ncbi:hypothetical protein, partial [Pseudomonas syringae group genomosp. 3]